LSGVQRFIKQNVPVGASNAHNAFGHASPKNWIDQVLVAAGERGAKNQKIIRHHQQDWDQPAKGGDHPRRYLLDQLSGPQHIKIVDHKGQDDHRSRQISYERQAQQQTDQEDGEILDFDRVRLGLDLEYQKKCPKQQRCGQLVAKINDAKWKTHRPQGDRQGDNI